MVMDAADNGKIYRLGNENNDEVIPTERTKR